MTSLISLHQRQVVAFPAGDPAGQLGGGEAGFHQLASVGASGLAQSVDQNDGLGLVLFQLADARSQLVLRNVDRANDMAGGVIFRRTDVHHHACVLVDQCGQFAGAQAFTAALHRVRQQQSQQYDEDTDKNVVVSGKFNQVSNHRRRFQGVKMSASIHSP